MANLYYPPKFGFKGHKPGDWPSGNLPASMSDAVNQVRASGDALYSSTDLMPIISGKGKGVSLPAPTGNGAPPLTIDITKPRAADWLSKNWPYVVGGGILFVTALLILRRPNR